MNSQCNGSCQPFTTVGERQSLAVIRYLVPNHRAQFSVGLALRQRRRMAARTDSDRDQECLEAVAESWRHGGETQTHLRPNRRGRLRSRACSLLLVRTGTRGSSCDPDPKTKGRRVEGLPRSSGSGIGITKTTDVAPKRRSHPVYSFLDAYALTGADFLK